MNTLNKVDVAKIVADKLGVTKKDALAVTEAVFETIVESLKAGDEVSIAKFGKFSTVHKDATTARNPQTGEDVDVPAKNVPKFKFSGVVKETVK